MEDKKTPKRDNWKIKDSENNLKPPKPEKKDFKDKHNPVPKPEEVEPDR